MAKPEDLLAAGAFLSVKEKLKNEATVDTVSVRVYRHPALGDRPVVRLTADNLAAGDDLTMEFLGFAAPEVNGPIAKRQRQALGFPGWAIIHDPDHARYALELVKEFKKAVRKSKAKPGHGYDAFVDIAKRLGKSVAHFLPSFWEQVGREFIALDNATYASRAFGKAREAEKVHALKVDESLRQDAFLEFALAGAVSIKALTEYGKELASTHDPQSAWTFFRELCVRRTLGGMPPWTSMLKDLLPLIKAAKLDPEQEVHSILTEIIDSPAIARANIGFWDNIAKYVGSLAAKNSHVAGALLNMIPQTSDWRTNTLWSWLDHLDAWGILSNAWKDNVDDDAKPAGGGVAWLNRLIQKGQRLHQKIFDIVQAMAPQLAKSDERVHPYQKSQYGNRNEADADLLDLLLELNIPFDDPPDELEINLCHWAVLGRDDKTPVNRPRDPVYLASASRFTSVMKKAISNAVGQHEFEAIATGKTALRDARHQWFLSVVDGLSNGALPGVESSLNLLDAKTSHATFAEFPDVLEKLKTADILPAVTRTLQCGLMDEYGWPLLEKVFADFAASGHPAPSLFGQFPYLIVTDRLKAVVLRGSEVVCEAELKLPVGHKLKQLMYIDGDLLVTSGSDHQGVVFWNSDPQPTDPEYFYSNTELSGIVVDAAGGGTFCGEKIVHKGGHAPKSLYAMENILSDGTHWWISKGEYESSRQETVYSIYEIDPATGKAGRKSMPTFFEDAVEDHWTLDVAALSLLPFGNHFPQSLLGRSGDLIGYRRRRNAARNVIQLESVDGRRLESSGDQAFSSLLNQPATDQFLPLHPSRSYRGWNGVELWDPTATFPVCEIKTGIGGYNRGQVAALPWHYFHAFEIRDLAASRKLRAVDDAKVKTLLEAEQQDHTNFQEGKIAPPVSSSVVDAIRASSKSDKTSKPILSESEHFPLLDAAIDKLLGPKSHLKLRIGIRGIIIRAGQQRRELAKLIQRRGTDSTNASGTTALVATSDETATMEFASAIGARFRPLPSINFAESLAGLTDFFSGKSSTTLFAPQWFGFVQSLVDGLPEKLWSAFSEDPTNTKWQPFIDMIPGISFFQLPGSFRKFVGDAAKDDFLAKEIAALNELGAAPKASGYESTWLIPIAGKNSRFLINKGYRSYDVLEYSSTGPFESIPDLTEREGSSTHVQPSVWSSQQFLAFAQLAKERSLPIPSLDMFKTLAEQIRSSVTEVVLVWFGMPNIDSYHANFMPAHLRDACKLKTRDCSAAKEALKAMPNSLVQSLVRAILNGEPAELWENPPTGPAERLRSVWSGATERLPLSAEWLEKLADAFGYGIDKQKIFQAMNSPAKDPMFSDQGDWSVGRKSKDGRPAVLCADPNSSAFTEGTFRAATISLAMLSYGMPAGDPAREKMCDVYKATTAALSNPTLLLEAGWRYEYDAKNPDAGKQLIESIIGPISQHDTLSVANDGVISVAIHGYQTLLACRPAALTNDTVLDKVANQFAALTAQKNEDNPTPESHSSLKLIQYLRLWRSPDFAALVQQMSEPAIPPGSYEANPKLSAPDVVKAVAKKVKISEEAAILYLQLLTLPDPTDKNVQLWNGWKSAEVKSLSKELADKGVVLEATRARAGRKYFLPGGWEDLKAPHLPLETWKMPLYGMTRDSYQRATPPLARIVPLEPMHQLFAKAWKRICDGDVPKYEEV